MRLNDVWRPRASWSSLAVSTLSVGRGSDGKAALAASAAAGTFLGIALGVLIADRAVLPVIAALVCGALLAAAIRVLVRPSDLRFVVALVAVAFALHLSVLVLLYSGSVAVGRGGFVTGDDEGYFRLAKYFALYLHGAPVQPFVPPNWNDQTFLFGAWVYLESAVFFVFGPILLLPLTLNATMMTATALLAYDTARSMFDRTAARVALVLILFFPSLVLWSSLNLKDPLALFLITAVLWSVVRFQHRPGWRPMVLAYVFLAPLDSLRLYVFFGLGLVVPTAVFVAPGLGRRRPFWGATAIAGTLVLFYAGQSGDVLGPTMLGVLESSRTRYESGTGARTSFQEPLPLQVNVGDTFVVPETPPPPVSAPTPVPATPPPATPPPATPPPATPPPATPPRVIHVGVDTKIVVATPGPVPPSPNVVLVNPGDVVVVGPPELTPKPAPRILEIPAKAETGIQLAPGPITGPFLGDELTLRTIRYVPTGLVYAFFAPFPWAIGRLVDLIAAPEMVLWYLVLAASLLTIWRFRQRWHLLAPLVLFTAGTLFELALLEGNAGTLFRHRSMVIPSVIILAAPTFAVFLATLSRARGSVPTRP